MLWISTGCNQLQWFTTRFTSRIHETQNGNLKEKAVDFAGATLKWSLQYAQAIGQPIVALYIDIRSAYYSVIHDILPRHKHTDLQVGEMLNELSIPDAFIGPIMETMRAPGLLENLTNDPHLNSILEETIYTTPGLP